MQDNIYWINQKNYNIIEGQLKQIDDKYILEQRFTSYRTKIFALSKKYNKTNVQVILRWHIQRGNVVFPKSTNPKHIKENSEIFDFSLTKEEMDEINKMGNTKRFYNFNVEQQEEMYMKYLLKD